MISDSLLFQDLHARHETGCLKNGYSQLLSFPATEYLMPICLSFLQFFLAALIVSRCSPPHYDGYH